MLNESTNKCLIAVGGDPNDSGCIPNVSQYTDCTDDNLCSGCTKCECTNQRVWDCSTFRQCPEDVQRAESEQDPLLDDNILENALQQMELESKKRYLSMKMHSENPLVPTPEENEEVEQPLLGPKKAYGNYEDDILSLINRKKRSTEEAQNMEEKRKTKKEHETNDTITFYNTVDELNEDTLKKTNSSGTIEAKRVEVLRQMPLTRRAGVFTNTNNTLNIKYNHPNVYDRHITDNKIESTHHDDHMMKLHKLMGNHTQDIKNKELSKLIVNELKSGTEFIGDKHAPVMSNVTFKPENDTLTAMAFIAGNLLNKLWNMEKDGDESLETEILKHEKIADLLDLFKEPLSIRQEAFLKNALEQLSNAVNKGNEQNVSLCKSIQEASKVLRDANNSKEELHKAAEDCSKDKDKDRADHSEKLPEKAISKIYNVFNLIKKYEDIKKHLSELKNIKKPDPQNENQPLNDTVAASTLTLDENTSIHMFGNILEKITKLLLPSKSTKKFAGKIKSQSVQSISKKIKKHYNIDVPSSNLSVKDKLLANYLDHIERNPECVLNDKSHESSDKTSPNIEGDILYNLSEFFKIKSLVDLLKMVDPKPVLKSMVMTPTIAVPTVTQTEVRTKNISKEDKKFASAKEKLKAHLRTIVEDLIELQNASGALGKEDSIKIVDALPCIYNLLNNNTFMKDNKNNEPVQKIRHMFENLKTEISTVPTRRTNPGVTGRPKSIVLWERIVKNLDKKQKIQTRRNLLKESPVTFESIKKIIDKLESSLSNSYKKYAFMAEVPPSDKLVLLKTLQADTSQYIHVMRELNGLLDMDSSMSLEKRKVSDEFIDNAAGNIKLNMKLIETLNKPKAGKSRFEVKNNSEIEDRKIPVVRQEAVTPTDFHASGNKISRDEIINTLIKNRVQLYIETKERAGEVLGNINYNVAKNIIMQMENGNYKLARELYKLFVPLKHDTENIQPEKLRNPIKPIEEMSPIPITRKEPLIQFVNTQDQMQLLNQNHLLKQLLNIKNMRV